MTNVNGRGGARPRSPARTDDLDDRGFAFLQCPLCGGSLARSAAGGVQCERCRTVTQAPGGIIDFVAGSSSTELDKLDYDAFYAISEAASQNLFELIQSAAGARWPSSLGNAVEIGCGTGGFSWAVLRQTPSDCMIVTDVSAKMLGICRNRLDRLDDVRADTVLFSTYSGTEDCFRSGVFDTCFGTSVVHHITDVPRLLAQIHRILKPGGRAFFMEPNGRFHRALTMTLAGILAEWSPRETVPEPQISLMMNWMAEVHCNIANSGDLEILAQREDKHYFLGEEFEAMAKAAGFARAAALPCGPDLVGWNAIETYFSQVGISRETLDRLRPVWSAAQEAHFGSLAVRDRSPSYLFWLEKGARGGRRRQVAARRSVSDGADMVPPVRMWMTLAIECRGTEVDMVAEGWCLAGEMVRAVRFTLCGVDRRLPIYLPRPDVHAAMNAGNAYPALHALCSGINGRIPLAEMAIGDDPIPVDVDILTAGDRVVPRGRYLIKPNAGSVLVS